MKRLFCALALGLLPLPAGAQVADIVSQAVTPVMAQEQIPGMQIGLVLHGQVQAYAFGVASLATRAPVTADTLFETGSVSKIFAATLAAYAQGRGALSLDDAVSAHLPGLRHTAFDHVTLRQLGTYTPGGMRLEVPAHLATAPQLIAYLRHWHPAYAPGSTRTYSNLSLGLLGFSAAQSLHVDYAAFVQTRMFAAFGLSHSFLTIPAAQAQNDAQGYRRDGTPIRQGSDILSPEAYGVRGTAGDLARFLAINMGDIPVAPAWQRAALATHTGYDRVPAGNMVQDLVWEQIELPASEAAMQAENSRAISQLPQPVTPILPPLPPRADVLLNKTGATNGFSSYVAFIPADATGIVILANRNVPGPAVIALAFRILAQLDPKGFRSIKP